MRGFVTAALAAIFLTLPTLAPAQDLIPERRTVLTQDQDLPGGDIASSLDTTLDACERACLTNSRCTAYTFNTRNGSCFVKSGPGEGTYFQGAYSAYVIDATPETDAKARRAELTFLSDGDVQNAYDLATNLGRQHTTGPWSAEEHLTAANEAEARGDLVQAAAFTGAALNLSDAPESWADYARLQLEVGKPQSNDQNYYLDRAVSSAVNAYLRAESAPLRHTALVTMADALERLGRGRDTVAALRLAQNLAPREDTAALLDSAMGKYGFRIAENTVESDLARPRICVTFSEDLVAAGVDYSSFVQLSDPGLTVENGGWRQLCVGGCAAWRALYRDLPRRAACGGWAGDGQIGADHGLCSRSQPRRALSGAGLCVAEGCRGGGSGRNGQR